MGHAPTLLPIPYNCSTILDALGFGRCEQQQQKKIMLLNPVPPRGAQKKILLPARGTL